MKKKLIVIAVAIVAILIIAYFGVGRKVVDKYTYGTDKADLNEYYKLTGDEIAIIVQDERIGYTALVKNGECYLPLKMIYDYIGDGFFYDAEFNGGTLMYTVADGTYECVVGASSYTYEGGAGDRSYALSIMNSGNLYIAVDYVKQFENFTYELNEKHVQVYTEWGSYTRMEITANTQIRVAGGIKSEILRDVGKGEFVELLEEMENWSKVKTNDSYIGYIENKKMKNMGVVNETEPIAPSLPAHKEFLADGKVCLGYHSIGGVGGNDTIYEMMKEGRGMNVIAPTWFSLNDNEGGIRNFGTANYIGIAHDNGLQVWGVVDDFNYRNETGNSISVLTVLGSTESRKRLEKNIVDAAVSLGLDGINLDFELITADSGPYFAQFVKELSVLTHQRGIVLSIADYVPAGREFYRFDVQGQFADYVIMMGYDEHWHGCGNPGSVASFNHVTNGLDKILENVPARKVINALPFYTIVWKSDASGVSDSYLTLVNQADYIARLGISYSWDETTCQNYAEWINGGVTYQVWFEDEESISVKLNAMNARGIGGVAAWRLGYGTSSVWNLLNLYVQN